MCSPTWPFIIAVVVVVVVLTQLSLIGVNIRCVEFQDWAEFQEYDDRDWGFHEIDSLFVPSVDTGRHLSETSGGYLHTS